MNRAVAVTLTVAALWALGSSWYYDCKIKRVCGPAAMAVPASAAVPAPSPLARSARPATTVPAPASQAPAAIKPAAAALSLSLYFDPRSAVPLVPPMTEATLPALLSAVAAGRQLRIVGHSDDRGTAERKALLASQRALILKDWLLARGVPAAAIVSISSRDDREPIADNTTAAGRAQNRRAVATLE